MDPIFRSKDRPWRGSVSTGRTDGCPLGLIRSLPVRRFIVILMLSLLPFQFVWGAAASYCQHGQGAGVSHFGHHVHKHQGKALKAAGESTPDNRNTAAGDDTDCATCHLSCVSPMMTTAMWFSSEVAEPMLAAPSSAQPGYIPSVIERPNWILAA